jgi:hypothetical protein
MVRKNTEGVSTDNFADISVTVLPNKPRIEPYSCHPACQPVSAGHFQQVN